MNIKNLTLVDATAIILILFSTDKQAIISFLNTQNSSSKTSPGTLIDANFHYENHHENSVSAM